MASASDTSDDKSKSKSGSREESLEAQIAQLQRDLKGIGATLASIAEQQVSSARGAAKGEVRHLVRTGQHAVEDLQDEFVHVEKQVKDAIRRRPLTAVAGAVAVGFVVALLTR